MRLTSLLPFLLTIGLLCANAELASAMTLDLADIVGGGNGTGTGSDQGINIQNGNAALAHVGADFTTPINSYTSSTNPFVDGVFIPDGNTGSPVDVQVSSTGILVSGFLDTNGRSWDHIWNGNSVFVSGGPAVSSRIGFHGQKGMTFDLDAIELANPGFDVTNFSGLAIRGNGAAVGTMEIFLDGVAVFQEQPGRAADIDFDIAIASDTRFLTLTAAGSAGAWNSWGDPTLVLSPMANAIPEPKTFMLVVIGSIGLMMLNRRHRQHKAS